MDLCEQCGNEYIPKRRGVQKFCSNSCRSRNWQLKQERPKKKKSKTSKKKKYPKATKQEKISLAGIGNAAIGYTAVEIIKNIATPDLQKPATKADINEIKTLIKGGFLPIRNMRKDISGKSPFYDVTNQIVIFL